MHFSMGLNRLLDSPVIANCLTSNNIMRLRMLSMAIGGGIICMKGVAMKAAAVSVAIKVMGICLIVLGGSMCVIGVGAFVALSCGVRIEAEQHA